MSKNNKKVIRSSEAREEGSSGINKFKVSDFIMMFILVLLCATCIVPFLHLLAKSISSNTAVLAKSVYLLPKGINFEAFKSVFRDGQLTYAMAYSVVITVIFTLCGLLVTIFAAYPLSRKRLKGRVLFTMMIMFTMYFSAGLIPDYLLMDRLNLLNNPLVLVLPLILAPYNFLIMKTFFQTNIPESLEESAFLDGATDSQFLWKIVIPLSKPIMATISLFLAVGRWNSFSDSKFYISEKSRQMVQYLLYQMVLASGDTSVGMNEATAAATTPEVLQAASVMFVTLPIVCIYPFVQKYFVKGVMVGAVKG